MQDPHVLKWITQYTPIAPQGFKIDTFSVQLQLISEEEAKTVSLAECKSSEPSFKPSFEWCPKNFLEGSGTFTDAVKRIETEVKGGRFKSIVGRNLTKDIALSDM